MAAATSFGAATPAAQHIRFTEGEDEGALPGSDLTLLQPRRIRK